VGYALGLALSALFDLPSGAVIVWTLAACGLLVRTGFGH
jgi:zinc/manganese transport system permease protein